MTQKKKTGISRLLEFGGRYRWMTVVACILSGLSSVLMLCPFLCIWLVLRDVLYKYVPKELMDRPKKGFSIPIAKWLKEPSLRAWAETLIDRRTLESQGMLNPEVVWTIWKDFVENGVWRIQIWYILMFQAWMAERKLAV